MPAEVRLRSYEIWAALPTTPPKSGAASKKPKFKAMPLREVSKLFVGTTKAQVST